MSLFVSYKRFLFWGNPNKRKKNAIFPKNHLTFVEFSLNICPIKMIDLF